MFIKENNEQNYLSNIIVKPHYCTISEIEFLNNNNTVYIVKMFCWNFQILNCNFLGKETDSLCSNACYEKYHSTYFKVNVLRKTFEYFNCYQESSQFSMCFTNLKSMLSNEFVNNQKY